MISIDSGSLVLLDPAIPTVSTTSSCCRVLAMLWSRRVAPRVGTLLVKMTRVWRVETHGEGVGADLLGDQQLL